MRILVTGGSGFLGSHLARSLAAEGHAVRVFGRSPTQLTDVEGVSGDIADEYAVDRAVEGCDAVFHAASKVGMGHSSEFFRVNVVGSRTVAAACRRSGVGLLVYTSSPSVVFNGKNIEGGNESLPYGAHFLSAYARTKAQAERELLAQADETLRICALRPHLIFGKDDPHLLPGVVAAARKNRLWRIGDGKNFVDVTHVKSAVRAHALALKALMEGRANGKAYFISQGDPVALWPWFDHLLGKVGLPPLKRRMPYPVAYALGALCEPFFKGKKQPPMTRFMASMLTHSHYFDISAAKRDLDYAPAISTEEGLEEWARAFLEARS